MESSEILLLFWTLEPVGKSASPKWSYVYTIRDGFFQG